MKVRILPVSTIDDPRTILQVVMRLQKYLEENPIRNIFYIDLSYDENTLAYDVTKVKTPTELDVSVAADDLLIFDNGYIALVDSVGDNYVTIVGDSAQEFIGRQGETGNGISSIAKTGTSGLIDTYTITFTNGTTSTFTVTNGANGQDGATGATGATGNGISSIAKTDTSGLIDTYTITFTNGNTTTFTVTNGANGQNGTDGVGVPTGGTDGQVLTKDGSTDYATKWSNLSGGLVTSENLIINPSMLINQRDVSGTITHSNTPRDNYTKDRWYLEEGTFTVGSGLNINNQLDAGGKLSQAIEYTYGRYTGRYIVCGVTVYKHPSGWSYPDVQLKNYLGTRYTAVGSNNINIAINNANGSTYYQFLTVYDVNDINASSYLWFTLDNTNNSNKAYIVNTFCYITDDKVHFTNTQYAIPVAMPNIETELKKCKYYYEKIEETSNGVVSYIHRTSSNANSSNYRIIFSTEKRIAPTYVNTSVVPYMVRYTIGSGFDYTNAALQYDSITTKYIQYTGWDPDRVMLERPTLYSNVLRIDAEIYP